MVLPRIISCVGMPRSGSTWIYNAVLAAAKTSGKARGSFSDDFPEDLASFAREDVQLVLKSHEPTGRLISLLDILDAPVVLTVRDPRDCIVSMMQAFGFDFEQSTRRIRDSSIALGQLKDFAKAKTVKYENCVDRMAVLQDLYAFLDLDIEASAAANIFESLTSEAVERSISEMIEQGALDEDQPAGSWTEETHWHPNHIGDGATGKFVQHLDQAQSDYVISLNPDFFCGARLHAGATAIRHTKGRNRLLRRGCDLSRTRLCLSRELGGMDPGRTGEDRTSGRTWRRKGSHRVQNADKQFVPACRVLIARKDRREQ